MPVSILNVGYDSCNYYLVGAPGAWLLVDAGWPGTLPKLLHALRAKDVPLTGVRYLLVTHYHPDHAGLAQELKQRGVRLVVVEGQRASIPTLRKYMKPGQGYVEITLDDNVDLRLADSRAFLAQLGIAGEIVSTPGHSADSVTLVTDEGAAFTGDLPAADAVMGHLAGAVIESWQRLRRFNLQTVYPGHGPSRPLTLNPAEFRV